MRLIIVSDNHGDANIVSEIANKYDDGKNILIHCGDSQLQPDSKAMKPWQAVAGNNDIALGYPDNRLIQARPERILVVHGHKDGVNFGLTKLSLHAQQERSTVCCYGHTHQLAVTTDHGCLFINPGSISLPRGKYRQLGGTFAVVEVQADSYQVQYYTREFKAVPELKFEFSRKGK